MEVENVNFAVLGEKKCLKKVLFEK
jgi:hypothetical protein